MASIIEQSEQAAFNRAFADSRDVANVSPAPAEGKEFEALEMGAAKTRSERGEPTEAWQPPKSDKREVIRDTPEQKRFRDLSVHRQNRRF